jgi:hypothetical protein
MLIRKFRKPIAERLGIMIKPVALLFLAFLLTFGLYVNRYIYAEIGEHLYIIPPAILQPYMGFIMGFLIAKHVAKQPTYRCITIAIETGVQNVTIPMVLLQGSFKQPFGDLAAVMPVTTAHFTPLPMLAAFFGLTIYKNVYLKRCKPEEVDVDDKTPADDKKDANGHVEVDRSGSVIRVDYRNDPFESKEKKDNLLRGLSPVEIRRNIEKLDRESVI